ncbi:hypothetical protein LINPERHAP1_LOCUS35019, partial [Linum perenne]
PTPHSPDKNRGSLRRRHHNGVTLLAVNLPSTLEHQRTSRSWPLDDLDWSRAIPLRMVDETAIEVEP